MNRTPTDDALLALIRMVMNASVRTADDLGGISTVQLRALTALRLASGANLAQLAQTMGITVSTASRLVDRLVAVDWVRRSPAAHDRREISLTLTEAGADLLRRYDDGRVVQLRECLGRVAPERRDGVVAALVEFTAAARA